jgi:hypothetical protein
MRAFFEGIEDLFVNVLFWPFDVLRYIQNWWTSNIISWIFIIIGIVAFTYWLLQLKKFDDSGEEDKTISSHSYL